MVQDPTKKSPLRSESDHRDAARTHPELIKGLVVDLVRARREHTLRGTGKVATAVYLILLFICFGMAGITYSGLLSNVRFPILLSPLRIGASTWVLFGIAVSLYLFAAQWKRRHAEDPRHLRLSNTLVLLVFASYMIASNFSFYGYLLIELVPALIFFASGAFSIAWSIDPAGRIALQCSKCKYEFTAGQSAPDLCPECGAFWLGDKGLTRRRQFEYSSPILFTGIIALLFGILSLIAVPTLHSRVPTQWLLPKAHGTALGMSDSEWARLDAANIDEKQRRQLAETLLLRRKRRTVMSHEGDEWFQAAITASLLPDDLVDRYHDEMVEVTLALPDTISAGKPFEVWLDTHPHTPLGNGRSIYVFFEGYRIDDSPPVGRAEAAIYGIWFGHVTNSFNQASRGNGPPPETLVIETPGSHTITAEYWIIGVKSLHAEPVIKYDGEGLLQRYPGWHYLKKLEISETIEVLPR